MTRTFFSLDIASIHLNSSKRQVGRFYVSLTALFSASLSLFFSFIIPLQVWIVLSAFLPPPPGSFSISQFYNSYSVILPSVYLLTTALLLLLTCEWIWFPLIDSWISHHRRNEIRSRLILQREVTNERLWLIVLAFSIIVSVLVSNYQWIQGYPLAGDSHYYSDVLRGMDTNGPGYALSFDRPILFLCLYAVKTILRLDPTLLLRLSLSVLSIFLVVSTFCFVRYASARVDIAGYAAIMAAISPHLTVGADAFLIANWVGLCLLLVFSYSFLKSMTNPKIWAPIAAALFVLILGMHIVTAIFVLVVVICFFLVRALENRKVNRFELTICGILCFIFGILIVFIVPNFNWLEEQASSLALFLGQASPNNLVAFLTNQFILYHYLGLRHFAIPILYLLGILGYVDVSHSRDNQHMWLKSWLIASSLGFFVAPYAEWWRFLYFIPLEILAAFGLFEIMKYLPGHYALAATVRANSIGLAVVLSTCTLLGFILAAPSAPLALIILSPIVTMIVGRYRLFPFSVTGVTTLFVTSLILEEIARALYVMR